MSVIAASERVARPKGTHWRRKAFAALIARDGPYCGLCACSERNLWRAMGQSCGAQWGEHPWERALFTFVYRVSNLEVDHRVPLSEGGDNEPPNLWLLCTDCHKVKTTAERSNRLKRLFADARA